MATGTKLLITSSTDFISVITKNFLPYRASSKKSVICEVWTNNSEWLKCYLSFMPKIGITCPKFFSPSSKKLFKKIHPWKIPYISGKWNFLALMLRNLLYFLKRKLFLYSWKRKRNFLKSQYITFRARNQIFLIFWEMERSDPKNLNTFFLNFLAPKELNKTFLSFLVPKSLRLVKILWT